MIRKTKRQSKYFAPQNENVAHVCDHPGCNKAGEYRAPKDASLKEYYWFCLEHVQQYNAKWNYFGDDPFAEPEEDLHKKFRFSSHIKYNFGFDFDDGYKFFDKYSYENVSPRFRLDETERQCLKILELSLDTLDAESLKKAYKKAVKKYHPDINSGNSQAEEIFKIISTAYKSLMQKISFKK